jgi:hypothetical protein
VRWLLPLALFLLLATAACGGDGSELPPPAGGPTDQAGLVFDGASYRTTGSRPMGSLSSSDLENVGRSDGEEDAVDVFRLRSGGKVWEVLTRSGGRWLTWEPLALDEARRDLSERLGVPEAQVSVEQVERVEWPDACLGAGGHDEVCAQVVTPGFRIVLEARGDQHVYHSDLKGNVRRAPD